MLCFDDIHRCTRKHLEWNTSQSSRLTSVCLSKSLVSRTKQSEQLCKCNSGPLDSPDDVVPFAPAGLPMSDQYVKLEEERRQKERAEKKKKEKKKRKEKRSSRGKKHDSGPESEEDITPAHMVDIVTEEMPEVRLGLVSTSLAAGWQDLLNQAIYKELTVITVNQKHREHRVCLHCGSRQYSVRDVGVISTSCPAFWITFLDCFQQVSV